VRILVTGGAGFIGSHVVDAYLEAGHEVIVADDLSSGSRRNLNIEARFFELDVRSDDLDALVRAEQPEVISHHAAQISVRRSMEEPLYDASVNVLGSLTVLEAARRHGVRRVVFASTGGAIYGEVGSGLADENHPCHPMSAYAISKLATEHYLEAYRLNHGLETIVLRYANVFGPRQDPHGEAGVVAIFIRKILAALTPVIFGDGEQTRDFVYVGDVVRANLAALEARPGDARSPVFNIATGRELSVNALWAMLAGIAGGQLVPLYEPPRPGDLRRSVLDPGRARRALGWHAEVPVMEGLRRTWEWFAAAEREHAAA
jgi:UDP-glucose 4-epimerase